MLFPQKGGITMLGFIEILSFFGFNMEAALDYIKKNEEKKKRDFPQSVIEEVLKEAGLD